MKSAVAILLAGVGLTGCQTMPPAGDGTCRDRDLARFVGQNATPMLGDEIRAASGARVIRWLGPDQAATEEYRADRITVRYDAARVVTQLQCS